MLLSQDEPATSSSRPDIDFEPYMQRAHLEALQRWQEIEIQRHLETEELRNRAPRRGVVRRQPDLSLESSREGNGDDAIQESSGMGRDGGNDDSEEQSRTEVVVRNEGDLAVNDGMDAAEVVSEHTVSDELVGALEPPLSIEHRPAREESSIQTSDSLHAAPSIIESRQQPQPRNLVQGTPTNPRENPANQPPNRVHVSVSELVRLQESARARAEGAQRERQMTRHRAAQRDRFLELEAAERERELAGLGQQRAVSAFAHRTRLQVQILFHD